MRETQFSWKQEVVDTHFELLRLWKGSVVESHSSISPVSKGIAM